MEYSCHFPDREQTFESITARAPFYMALNLLRIARNDYVGWDYGGRLVAQAKQLLRASAVSDGFTTLWERHRLDLSVEAHVVREEYAALFSDEERRIASRRLADYGYTAG